MRTLLAICMLIGTAGASHADLRKSDCGATAQTLAKDIDAARRVLDRMLAVSLVPLIKGASGSIKAAAESTAQAQAPAISGLDGYIRKQEDLARELRDCAR